MHSQRVCVCQLEQFTQPDMEATHSSLSHSQLFKLGFLFSDSTDSDILDSLFGGMSMCLRIGGKTSD